MKTKFKSSIRAACHSFGGAVCAGAFLLLASSTQAQNLFVADFSNNSIEIFNSSGSESVFANSGLDGPMGLAFDNAGNLYVGNWYNNTIVKYNTAGQYSVFAGSGLNNPRGLACDANGNLYVANYNGDDVIEFNAAGQSRVFASGINQPTGLAFDGQGNLYVADRSDQILKYNSSGQGTVFASTGSTGPGPEGLAFDGVGNLYVANYWNNAIYKFNPSGNGGIWASTGGATTTHSVWPTPTELFMRPATSMRSRRSTRTGTVVSLPVLRTDRGLWPSSPCLNPRLWGCWPSACLG
jgi:sugar lactone lactonase YvrE